MKTPFKVSGSEYKVFDHICFRKNPVVTIEDDEFIKWFHDKAYNSKGFKTLDKAKRRCSSILSRLHSRGFLDRVKVKNIKHWRYAYFIRTEEKDTDA